MSLFRIRAGLPSDIAWVLDSWVRSYGETALARSCRGAVYGAGQRALIKALLERPEARLVVACAPDDDNTILGWALVEGDALHYVHVKTFLRRHGVAKALIPAEVRRYTHKTLDFERCFRARDWTYDPYAAFVVKEAA